MVIPLSPEALADYGITTQAALDAVLFDHRQA